jgi:hypothetical protein
MLNPFWDDLHGPPSPKWKKKKEKKETEKGGDPDSYHSKAPRFVWVAYKFINVPS